MALISSDSPLRTLPVGLVPRQGLVLDGLRISAEMADIAYQRLCADALRSSTDNPAAERPPMASLFLDALSIVDSVHRLRCLLLALPEGPRGNPPEVDIGGPVGAPSVVRDLRDTVQHLEPRLGGMANSHQPVFGTLLWVLPSDRPHDRRIMMAIPGSIREVTTPGAAIADLAATAQPPIDHVILTSHQAPRRAKAALGAAGFVVGSGIVAVSLSRVLEQVGAAIHSLERSLRQQFQDHPTAGADVILGVEIELDGGGKAGAGEDLAQPDE